jgi:integrase/recombinase XerD
MLGNIRADIHKANANPAFHRFRPEGYLYQDTVHHLFETMLETWLGKKEELYEKDKRAWATIVSYRSQSKHFAYFAKLDVRKITKADIEEFFNTHLYKKGVRKKSSLKTIRSCLHAFFSWLKDDVEVISRIPMFSEIEGEESEPRVAMAPVQQQKALESIPEQYQDLLLFNMSTGLRPAEVCAIQIRDINDGNSITIRRTFSAGKLHEKTKQKQIRTIHLSKLAILIMKKNAEGKMKHEFLFTQKNGKHFRPNIVSQVWTAKSGTGVKLYQAVRHSLATWMLKEGVPVGYISKMLGHSSIVTTQNYLAVESIDMTDWMDKREKEFTKVVDLPLQQTSQRRRNED